MYYAISFLVLHSHIGVEEGELVALFKLSSWRLWLYLTVSRVGLQYVIVVFRDHTHLRLDTNRQNANWANKTIEQEKSPNIGQQQHTYSLGLKYVYWSKSLYSFHCSHAIRWLTRRQQGLHTVLSTFSDLHVSELALLGGMKSCISIIVQPDRFCVILLFFFKKLRVSSLAWQSSHRGVEYRNSSWVERKIRPWDHRLASRGLPIYPILTRLMDCFSCSPFITAFYIQKGFQNFWNTLRHDITWWRNFKITMTSLVFVWFLSSPGFEIDLFHMGKNSENFDLVCKKAVFFALIVLFLIYVCS